MDRQMQFLEETKQLIAQSLATLEESILQGESEVAAMHEYYWQNYTEMDEYGYENFDNQQALLTQINANTRQLKLKSRLKKLLNSPYFGRVDYLYDGDDAPETFYIGIGNYAPQKGERPLIYDWRAPVSSLFYDYDSGPAAYEAPMGTLTGEITGKWQYKIRKGKLVYALASDVKIDDEVLKKELSEHGDTKLKNIIRTIQKEQNAIIRNREDRILLIQGAAGSGKTSVALHRIAYLLYHDRKQLNARNVLILSPNSVFSDYISRILPELGEEPVREVSLDTLAYHRLKDVIGDCEDRYDALERRLSGGTGFNEEKQTKAFADDIFAQVLMLEDELMHFSTFSLRGYTKSAGEIQTLFYERFAGHPLLRRMDEIREYCVDEYETLTGRTLSQEDADQVRLFFDGMYETKDVYILYSRFLEQSGYEGLPHVHQESRKVSYEDVYPLLYMKLLLTGAGADKSIRHLVIDEMQDYSYIQYSVLQQLFDCPMTILGDMAQTMEGESNDVTAFLPGLLGKDVRILRMEKSYRNTAPIARYSAALIGDEHTDLFEREGDEVELWHTKSREDSLKRLLAAYRSRPSETETSAALFYTMAEARQAYELLSDELGDEVSLIDKDSSRFSSGLTLTTWYLAKGLEFEQVYSVMKESDTTPLALRARYISATRAMHRLAVLEEEI